jgi:hypothetical protein
MATPQTPESKRRWEKAKKYLRLFLLDTPAFNRLIRTEESDDDLISFALDMAIDDWNTTAPVIGNTHIGNFPSLYLLMHAAAIQVLKSQGLRQARNELNYNTGGSSFIRSNKSNYYMSWLTNFAQEFEGKKRNLKVFQNITGGWGGGGVASEYDRIGYSW